MSIVNEGQPKPLPGQEEFIRKALAQVEKAYRFQRIKQITITVLAFIAAFWWAYKKPGPELGIEGAVFIGVGMMLAVCTAKVMSLINKSTRAILQAVADLHSKNS